MAFLTQGFVKVSGQLKEAKNAWVKMGGTFKKILTVNEMKCGQWGEVWLPIVPIPAGTIVAWAGTAEEIPSGWFLCDGLNGTPNLVDRFVMGGDDSGETGSSTHTHTHTLTTDGAHTHTLYSVTHTHSASYYGDGGDRGLDCQVTLDNAKFESAGGHTHTTGGLGGDHNHGGLDAASAGTPSYYELAFIIKG